MGLWPITREILPKDVEACVEIVQLNWNETVAERFRSEVDLAFVTDTSHPYAPKDWQPKYYVTEFDGKVVAFAGMMASWIMHGVWDFIWINVHPDHQNQKAWHHGTMLTNLRIEEVKKRGGTLISLMTQKYEFFERFGFRINRVFGDSKSGGWAHMSLQLEEVKL